MNTELRRLLEEDQKDLREMNPSRVERDRARRERVRKIEVEGGLRDAEDFLFAAVIFQHGEELPDWLQAYHWAKRAVDMGCTEAKWLAAAALDRWLLFQGKPIKYGCQFLLFGGVYRLPPVDDTSDEERMAWGVSTLAERLALRDIQGLPIRKRVAAGSASVEGWQIDVIVLERHLAHNPPIKGTIAGYDKEDRPVWQNSYGWNWIENSEGLVVTCWLPIPHAPVIAHIVADAEKLYLQADRFKGLPVIWVEVDQNYTLYVENKGKIWAISGKARGEIEQVCTYILDGSYNSPGPK
ncbi:hypothetical protein NDK47_14450 [Brevibacillus ruminantium]|uniref:Uncharacterized protein n=1 Tax=Brevibacillus ruminantium TaxID=2950604 RepID=A0ABY4W8N7_9BACL|nr:hypothetical protein [Brevibacillus ruminantium]USG63382.1 hypothetical protein NDK47_14450 [Brevibacillus ruminantium]